MKKNILKKVILLLALGSIALNSIPSLVNNQLRNSLDTKKPQNQIRLGESDKIYLNKKLSYFGGDIKASAESEIIDSIVPGELIVKFKDLTTKESFIRENIGDSAINPSLVTKISTPTTGDDLQDKKNILNLVDQLKNDDRISWAEPNIIARRSFVPNDTKYNDQWALKNTGQNTLGYFDPFPTVVFPTPGFDIKAEQAWDVTQGNGTVIAILDDGMDYTHPDLAPNIYRDSSGRIIGKNIGDNCFYSNNDGTDNAACNYKIIPLDPNYGHGTAVAGAAAAKGNNSSGISGACPNCKIMPIGLESLASGPASLNTANIYDGMVYAVNNGAKVINLSLGYNSFNQAISDVIDYAFANNIVIVASSGNCGVAADVGSYGCVTQNQLEYPASYPKVISVSGSNPDGRRSDFATVNSMVDITGPARNIWTTLSQYTTSNCPSAILSGTSYLCFESGTSFSSPITAGVVGLIIGQNPNFSYSQIEAALKNGSTNVYTLNPSLVGLMGSGNVNACGALVGCVTNPLSSSSTAISSSSQPNILSGNININFCQGNTGITTLNLTSGVNTNELNLISQTFPGGVINSFSNLTGRLDINYVPNLSVVANLGIIPGPYNLVLQESNNLGKVGGQKEYNLIFSVVNCSSSSSVTPVVISSSSATPTVSITGVTIVGSQYQINFTPVNYVPTPGGMHTHFYYNTEPSTITNKMFSGPSPYLLNISTKPANATQICAIVSNPNHAAINNTGNCFDLPAIIQSSSAVLSSSLIVAVSSSVVSSSSLVQSSSSQLLSSSQISSSVLSSSVESSSTIQYSFGSFLPYAALTGAVGSAFPAFNLSGCNLPAGSTPVTISTGISSIGGTITNCIFTPNSGSNILPGFQATSTLNLNSVGVPSIIIPVSFSLPISSSSLLSSSLVSSSVLSSSLISSSTISSSQNQTSSSSISPTVVITSVTINGSQYQINFTPNAYVPIIGGIHTHFYYNTEPNTITDKMYSGTSPYLLNTSTKPANATQICAIVANSNHTIINNSGNCYTLPVILQSSSLISSSSRSSSIISSSSQPNVLISPSSISSTASSTQSSSVPGIIVTVNNSGGSINISNVNKQISSSVLSVSSASSSTNIISSPATKTKLDSKNELGIKNGEVTLKLDGEGECSKPIEANIKTAKDQSIKDSGNSYPFGVVNFKVKCSTEVKVKLYFPMVNDWNDYKLRKLIFDKNNISYKWEDYKTKLSFEIVEGQKVATSEFIIKDGEYGDDTAKDGYIVDPIGLVKTTYSEESKQNTDLGKNVNEEEDFAQFILARTGGVDTLNITLFILSMVVVLMFFTTKMKDKKKI